MREMSAQEVERVGGGVIPLLATLGFVWYQADQISSFFHGFFEGAGAASRGRA